jgi:hypothetical protein
MDKFHYGLHQDKPHVNYISLFSLSKVEGYTTRDPAFTHILVPSEKVNIERCLKG